jgi:hypothetical protein
MPSEVDELQQVLLNKLRHADQLDFSHSVSRSATPRRAQDAAGHLVRALHGQGEEGSKHHVLTDARGTVLCVSLTSGNRNDITQLIPLVEAIPPVARKARTTPSPPG